MTTPVSLYDHIPLDDEAEEKHVTWAGATILEACCEEEEEEDEEDDDDPPMETILEESSTDYIFVPSYSLPPPMLPPQPEPVQEAFATVLSDVLEEAHEEILVAQAVTTENQNQPCSRTSSSNDPSSRSSWWKSLKYYVRKAARKSLAWTMLRSRANSIYSSYDWVSDTVLDEQGNRLVLPGQLIIMDDDNPCDPSAPTEQDWIDRLSGSCLEEDEEPLAATTTIMVSAHDLLRTQRLLQHPDATSEEEPTWLRRSSTLTLSEQIWWIASRKTYLTMQQCNLRLRRSRERLWYRLRRLEDRTRIVAGTSGWLAQRYGAWFVGDHDDLVEEGEDSSESKNGNVSSSQQINIELTTTTTTTTAAASQSERVVNDD